MSTRISRTLFVLLLLLSFVSLSTWAQTNVGPEQLLVLVAGPSGDRIDPQEKAVVDHLNRLRGEYQFSQLQMGTMHYDRPQEAALLQNVLGFSPAKGVTVGLVQLSEQGVPFRTIYKMESVTQGKLLNAQNEVLSRWSRTTGQPLPAGLRPQTPTASNGSTPSPSQPPSAVAPPVGAESGIYTEEGIRYVIDVLNNQVGDLWGTLRNAPLREDGNDLVLREKTKALSEATAALRAKNQAGVILPLEEVLAVARAGKEWTASEPQYFLPVPLRLEVKPLTGLLKMIDEIAAQGTRLQQSAPGSF